MSFALRRRRNGAPRPDPRPERAVQRRHQPGQGQPRRGRLLSTRTASCRCCNACRRPRRRWSRRRRRAATCPSTASPPTTRPCRAWSSAPTATSCTAGRVATIQALGGTGGLKVGADLPQAHDARRQGADQRPELGEPPRAVHNAGFAGRAPIRTTTPRARGVDFDGDARARCDARRPAPSSCCTPAATTRPATTSRRRSGTR